MLGERCLLERAWRLISRVESSVCSCHSGSNGRVGRAQGAAGFLREFFLDMWAGRGFVRLFLVERGWIRLDASFGLRPCFLSCPLFSLYTRRYIRLTTSARYRLSFVFHFFTKVVREGSCFGVMRWVFLWCIIFLVDRGFLGETSKLHIDVWGGLK